MNDSKVFNVLHIITRLPTGGVENMLYKVVTNYNRNRFNPVVCCIEKGGEVADKLKQAGIKVYILYRKKNTFDWKVIRDIYRIIKKENIHIIRTHMFHAGMYGRIAGIFAGVKIMIPSFHSLYRSPENPKLIRRIINHFLSKFSYKIVAVSKAIARDIIRYDRVRPRKIEVINNGIPLERFDINISKEEARRRFNLPVSKIIIGNVGRFSEAKGQKFLIESVSHLKDVLLVIVGDGPLRGFLEEQVKRLRVDCKFIGTLDPDEIPLFLKTLDIFCFPSLWEGWGTALVEAMASGLPVVASDIPPIREVLDDSGILVPPGNSDKLSEVLKGLIDDPFLRETMGMKAKERSKLFSIERTVTSYELLFEDALKEKGLL